MVRIRFGIPSLKKHLSARTSLKRYVRHGLGLKVPRGWGWLTNPRKATYNRVSNSTTAGLCFLASVSVVAASLASPTIFTGEPVSTEVVITKCELTIEPAKQPTRSVAKLIVRMHGNVIDKTTPGTVLVGVKVLLRKKDGKWLVQDAEGEPVRPGLGR